MLSGRMCRLSRQVRNWLERTNGNTLHCYEQCCTDDEVRHHDHAASAEVAPATAGTELVACAEPSEHTSGFTRVAAKSAANIVNLTGCAV